MEVVYILGMGNDSRIVGISSNIEYWMCVSLSPLLKKLKTFFLKKKALETQTCSCYTLDLIRGCPYSTKSSAIHIYLYYIITEQKKSILSVCLRSLTVWREQWLCFVWTSFNKINEKEVQCKLCQVKLAYHGSTTTMHNHLRSKRATFIEGEGFVPSRKMVTSRLDKLFEDGASDLWCACYISAIRVCLFRCWTNCQQIAHPSSPRTCGYANFFKHKYGIDR